MTGHDDRHRLLYRQDALPLFQNVVYDTVAEARDCPTGDIVLVEDRVTGLVRNAAFEPARMRYDHRYQNEQAGSAVFRDHLERVADIVGRWSDGRPVVEIGCGKGSFLEILARRGLDVTGFDPAYEGTDPRVRRSCHVADDATPRSCIVMRHVLEHIDDPVAFLAGLRDAGGGTICIEVPCLDWVLRRRAWFDVYYEHVNYFRLTDFHRMFGEVLECGRLFGDQYLYVVADLATLRTPVFDPPDAVRMPSGFTRSLGVPTGAGDGPCAVWGSTSKGVVFALLRERRGAPCDIVVDINPARQGRYLPGTGLQVLAPEAALRRLPPGATIHVMNSNYLEEIRTMSGDSYRYVVVDHEQL